MHNGEYRVCDICNEVNQLKCYFKANEWPGGRITENKFICGKCEGMLGCEFKTINLILVNVDE